MSTAQTGKQGVSKASKKLNILLVEDEPSLMDLYTVALKSLGGVQRASTAEDAVATVLKEAALLDIVLLDLIIPEKPGATLDFNDRWGFHVLKSIRENESTTHLPVLVMTNLDSAEDRAQADALQATAYIVKSNIVPKDIVKRIQEAL